MSKLRGFVGKLLRVDLTRKKIASEALKTSVAKRFMGGKGYSAYILYNELKRGVDPLSPKNKLVFMTGPLTGTRAPTGNRFCVCTKSPATGAWLDAHCGGSWGPELKFAGYDGIIVEGKAEKPVYINVVDRKATIHDASWLWGTDTFSTERILKDRLCSDRMPRVAEIGPAGESMLPLASVMSEARAAGRGGAGAVMGSKNLKAIVVTGHKYKPEDLIADPAKFRASLRKAHRKIREDWRTSAKLKGQLVIRGTANIADGINEAGGWPTRNFQTGYFEQVREVDGPAFAENIYVPRESPGTRPCWNCPIMCAHLGVVEKGRWAGTADEGPEYETIWAFGPQCGLADREAITRADYLCDYYGLDTISVGNTIGFLMECYEKGLIGKEETDGVELRFGNAEAMVQAVEYAGTGRGRLGVLVANGAKRAAQAIGKGSEEFAMHVKGLEMPAYDPRAAQGMGLAYARSDRGACHLRPWTAGKEMLGWDAMDPRTTEGKAREVKTSVEKVNVAWDSSGFCIFVSFALDEVDCYNMIVAATGLRYKDVAEFVEIGERINNLVRMFNIREGFTRKDDTLPPRSLKEPLPYGPCKGLTVKLEVLLDDYYKLCGWDEMGRPTKEKLKELGLDFV